MIQVDGNGNPPENQSPLLSLEEVAENMRNE